VTPQPRTCGPSTPPPRPPTAGVEYWKYTHLTIDVVPGRGAGFSVESPEGKRFLIRSRMLTDDELRAFGLDEAVAGAGAVAPA